MVNFFFGHISYLKENTVSIIKAIKGEVIS
jgi:hypothetical protein